MILKIEWTLKRAKTAERNSTMCQCTFRPLATKNLNVDVEIMIYSQHNSTFLRQKKYYSIHYLPIQNQGLSRLKNIWPVIMTGDLLSGLSKVASCRRKSPPTWLVSAGYSTWHFFTDGLISESSTLDIRDLKFGILLMSLTKNYLIFN